MIDKLPSIQHPKIQVLSEEKKNGDQRQQQERKQDGAKKEQKTAVANSIEFKIDEVLDFLNADEYYQSKGMSFSLSEAHDAKLVFVKDSNSEIIQRLELSQAHALYERLLAKDGKKNPIKGGILNINC